MKQIQHFLIASVFFLLTGCHSTQKRMETSLVLQLQQYPEATLQDVYKNFYQDRFGPGHAISNPEAVMQYLERELSTMKAVKTPQQAELLGWEHRFVRIPLTMVTEGKITMEELNALFIASAFEIKPEAGNKWKKEWQQITRIIKKKNLQIKHFEEDTKLIDSLLNENPIIALHHSQAFREHYHPHYRIVKKELWEEKMGKIILKK